MQASVTRGHTESAPVFGQAEVLESDAAGEHVRVRLLDNWDSAGKWARLALGASPTPLVGDRVLIAGDADDLYVLGCLSGKRESSTRLTTSSGTYAEAVQSTNGGESLRVISANGELLFEVDAVAGMTRVAIPTGPLELANQGDLVFRSAGTIRFEGAAVELCARRSIRLAVVRSMVAASSWLRLLSERVEVGGERVDVSAREGTWQLARGTIRAETLVTEADCYQLRAGKVETIAETVIERAGNVFRTVRDLAQLQAGRLRTYVSGLAHFRSKRAYYSSEESFHINGDKIHIG